MLKMLLVTPAYNEEEYIECTLRSMAAQNYLPKRWIVVDDGSSDRTADIIADYAQRYDWITLVRKTEKQARSIGSKVVETFYFGLDTVDWNEYDIIAKFDSDLTFPDNYLERIASEFEDNKKAGMVGGVCSILKEGKWQIETVADKDHIRGALKAYRKELFAQMGGIRRSMGWDTVDELLAAYHGWQVVVLPELVVKHHRVTNQETGQLKACEKMGRSFHKLGYGPMISSIAALKIGFARSPKIKSGWAAFRGYLKALMSSESIVVSPEEAKFIRKYRKQRILGKLLGKKSQESL